MPDEHPHLFDLEAHRPACVCRACALLFDRPGAAGGRYRAIPGRRLPVAGVAPAALGAPVGLAFFVVADDGTVSAHYPSPAGATRAEVDPEAWAEALEAAPPLGGLAPEVEALLVNTVERRTEAWMVPISDCYALVGVVRQAWEGLSGGRRVLDAIEAHFENLRRTDGTDPGR